MSTYSGNDPARGCALMLLALGAFWIIALALVIWWFTR